MAKKTFHFQHLFPINQNRLTWLIGTNCKLQNAFWVETIYCKHKSQFALDLDLQKLEINKSWIKLQRTFSSVCLFVCLSVCLFVCLSVCLFVCFSRSVWKCRSKYSTHYRTFSLIKYLKLFIILMACKQKKVKVTALHSFKTFQYLPEQNRSDLKSKLFFKLTNCLLTSSSFVSNVI